MFFPQRIKFSLDTRVPLSREDEEIFRLSQDPNHAEAKVIRDMFFNFTQEERFEGDLDDAINRAEDKVEELFEFHRIGQENAQMLLQDPEGFIEILLQEAYFFDRMRKRFAIDSLAREARGEDVGEIIFLYKDFIGLINLTEFPRQIDEQTYIKAWELSLFCDSSVDYMFFALAFRKKVLKMLMNNKHDE